MNGALKALLLSLISKRCFGGKHVPEKLMMKQKTRHSNKDEEKQFSKEYDILVKQGIILRKMKRTGKGYDWHISLNSRKRKDIEAMIKDNGDAE